MPLKYFNCQAGKITVSDCLNKCPNRDGRCLSLPTLYEISKQRPDTGVYSTTQLIAPTRIAYLRLKNDYAIDPYDQAFQLLGTRHHHKLDVMAKKIDMISEKYMNDGETTGILDLLEPDIKRADCYILWDYKTWGSHPVAKALGIVRENGKFITKPEAADLKDTALQLNNYRLKVESLGFPISQMFVQATVRDGGTSIASSRGITSNLYKIAIPRIDNDEVIEYFNIKNAALKNAVDNDEIPPICSYEERWGGRRCTRYCEVKEFCPEVSKPKTSYSASPYPSL